MCLCILKQPYISAFYKLCVKCFGYFTFVFFLCVLLCSFASLSLSVCLSEFSASSCGLICIPYDVCAYIFLYIYIYVQWLRLFPWPCINVCMCWFVNVCVNRIKRWTKLNGMKYTSALTEAEAVVILLLFSSYKYI